MVSRQLPFRATIPPHPFAPFEKADIHRSAARRFEDIVERFPGNTAVKTPHQHHTYRQLNHLANQIAHHILDRPDPTAGEQVAILLDAPGPTIAALLACLKVGKAYVALDPAFPQERLAYMISDAEAYLVITDRPLEPLADAIRPAGCDTLFLDQLDSDRGDSNPERSVSAEDRAFIVYTSGSSGRPKGIEHSQRNLLHNIWNYSHLLHVGPEDRSTLLHSFGFSSSTVDIFLALLNGATLYPWNVNRAGFAGLGDWLVDEGITLFNWSPTPFRYFAETLAEGETLSTLRLLMLGSEPVTLRDVELYRKYCPDDCLLVNRLGATEVNNFCLFFLDQQTQLEGFLVPGGYPVEDKEVFLLDDRGRRVGRDEVGQIAVRSPYISAGYWRMPEATRKVFLPDPDGGDARTYLTGDLGTMARDGCITHLGRKDFQVKIRGHRIELSEIERALNAVDVVREAVVVAETGEAGEAQLAAYLVLGEADSVSVQLLRQHLGERLPDYMIPSRFARVDALPLTPTGKLDRRALAAMDATPLVDARPRVGPRTPTEEELLAMWRDLLGVEDIGVRDDFFELGGHSLLVAHLFDRIERKLGRTLPLATLLTAPTIAQLAEVVDEQRQAELWSCLVPIKPHGTNPPLFFIHAHGGNVVGYHDIARYLDEEQPFFGLQARGLDGSLTSPPVFEDMARHYVDEIRTVQPHGPYFLGGFCFGGCMALEMAQQLQARGEDVALVVLIQSTPHHYPAYLPGRSAFVRLFDRLVERADLEIGNFREVEATRKWSYLHSRVERIRTLSQVYFEGGIGSRLRPSEGDRSRSQLYRLEMLGHYHNAAYRNYQFRPYDGDVLLFRAQKQRLGIQPDPMLGWGELVRGNLETHEIPGHRIGMISEPRVQLVVKRLQDSALFKERIAS